MISFAFTAWDTEILDEARAQARLAVHYARDFERDEGSMLPPAYPEAEGDVPRAGVTGLTSWRWRTSSHLRNLRTRSPSPHC
jgi:hypothetical protein